MKSDLEDLTAAILVGGLGTRLRAVVSDRPKPLAEVAGRPFLDRLLDQLAQAGVRRAVLLTGHQGEVVEATYGDRHGHVAIAYSHEASPLGTGGALRQAHRHLPDGPTLLLNGDSFVEVDLAAFRHFHARANDRPHASMVLVRVPDGSRYGRVELADDLAVTAFHEKGGDTTPGWINAGVLLIDQPLLLALPEGQPLSLEREVMPTWVADRALHGFATHGKFIDIGTPATYAESQTFFDA